MSKSETENAVNSTDLDQGEPNDAVDQVFQRLRGYLDDISNEPMPQEMLRLLKELESVS